MLVPVALTSLLIGLLLAPFIKSRDPYFIKVYVIGMDLAIKSVAKVARAYYYLKHLLFVAVVGLGLITCAPAKVTTSTNSASSVKQTYDSASTTEALDYHRLEAKIATVLNKVSELSQKSNERQTAIDRDTAGRIIREVVTERNTDTRSFSYDEMLAFTSIIDSLKAEYNKRDSVYAKLNADSKGTAKVTEKRVNWGLAIAMIVAASLVLVTVLLALRFRILR